MRISSFDWDGGDAAALATEIRGMQPPLGELSDAVAGIIRAVRERGDDAVAEFEARFGAGSAEPGSVPVPVADARAALERIDPDLRDAMETAAANIRAVADAQLSDERRGRLPPGPPGGGPAGSPRAPPRYPPGGGPAG